MKITIYGWSTRELSIYGKGANDTWAELSHSLVERTGREELMMGSPLLNNGRTH
jgi:hypothetical protein